MDVFDTRMLKYNTVHYNQTRVGQRLLQQGGQRGESWRRNHTDAPLFGVCVCVCVYCYASPVLLHTMHVVHGAPLLSWCIHRSNLRMCIRVRMHVRRRQRVHMANMTHGGPSPCCAPPQPLRMCCFRKLLVGCVVASCQSQSCSTMSIVHAFITIMITMFLTTAAS